VALLTLLIPLITVLATAILILYAETRHGVWFRRPARGGVLRDTVFGMAELTLPSGWRPEPDLNEQAPIQAADPLRGRYVVIISEARDDFDPAMGIEQHSVDTRDTLTSSLRLLTTCGPVRREVAGFEAIQFEIEAVHDFTRIRYLHTTIGGRRAFHQVIAWAPYSRYDRRVFEKLLEGFREPPGPEPSLLVSERLPVHVVPTSSYDVH
jgi:hypothetical protein